VSVINILFTPRPAVHHHRLNAAPVESLTLWYQQQSNNPSAAAYSHSIVAGGLDEMS
jgi:hypothetical protein